MPDFIKAETTYTVKVKAELQGKESGWSEEAEFTTPKYPKFSESAWKECPDNVNKWLKYSVDETNPRIATFIGGLWCTIIGNIPIPQNKVTSWSTKIMKSEYSNGCLIFIGVAPSDINQNEEDKYEKCGWYFYCYCSSLWSGPPHNYKGKEYGPRKGNGQYVHTGDSVGVVMDTAKGELSFVVNGVNLGVAYEGISLDKPLVPCVCLKNNGDSMKIKCSGDKEKNVI